MGITTQTHGICAPTTICPPGKLTGNLPQLSRSHSGLWPTLGLLVEDHNHYDIVPVNTSGSGPSRYRMPPAPGRQGSTRADTPPSAGKANQIDYRAISTKINPRLRSEKKERRSQTLPTPTSMHEEQLFEFLRYKHLQEKISE